MSAASILWRDVEVDGDRVDVEVRGDRVSAIGAGLARRPGAIDHVIEGGGGALLPGLHDHHVHVLATAAALTSVALDPRHAPTGDVLRERLRAAARTAPGEWIRAVGYHESVAGDLDRWVLDQVVADQPVRVQHRSGALWMLNSSALERIGPLDREAGVDRRADGEPTGRFFRADAWLADRWPTQPIDLAAVGERLAACGVTGVTDATPFPTLVGPELVAGAVRSGALPQHVTVMGGPLLAGVPLPDAVGRGPVKLLLHDHDLPDHQTLVGWISAARAHRRPVAVHCVTAEALVITMAALVDAGPVPGDRIEHGSVIPAGLLVDLAELGVQVVTQPNFVAERGDDYLRDVDAADQPFLWPCRSLLDAGIPVAAGTDAPYGDLDPWASIAAAIDRRTATGQVLGGHERLAPAAALALFLGCPDDPGGPPRRVEVGAVADLCLLHVPLADALAAPSAAHVRTTMIAGQLRG